MRSLTTSSDVFSAMRKGALGGLVFGLFQCAKTRPHKSMWGETSFPDLEDMLILAVCVTSGVIGLPILLALKDALFEKESMIVPRVSNMPS